MKQPGTIEVEPRREASGAACTWLLHPFWVYGLFIFVNLSQYAWMFAAAGYHHVAFGRVASGSVKTPEVALIRGFLGPAVGIPLLVFALRVLGPRGLDWSVLRAARPRQLLVGAGFASLAILSVMAIEFLAGVAGVSGGAARMPVDSLAAVVCGKLLWSVFKTALEDILFIGILARSWAAARGWRTAAIGTGIFFGAIHLLNILPVLTFSRALNIIVAGATFGALLTVLAVRYRSLWVPIGFHAAWNVWLGTVLGTTLSGTNDLGGIWLTELKGPTWMTGGTFGVEASWLSVLITGALLVCFAAMHEHDRVRTVVEHPRIS